MEREVYMELISIDKINSITIDDISRMDKNTLLSNIRHWIYNYKNTPSKSNKKVLKYTALMCVSYMSKYHMEKIVDYGCWLYNKIRKNETTDFIKRFTVNEQYESALYWLYKRHNSKFEKALFTTQPNKNMAKLFYDFFEDDSLDEEDIHKFRRRVKEALIELLHPMYIKRINEKYDIVITENRKENNQLVLSIKLPTEYCEPKYKNEVNIYLNYNVRNQWKDIYNGIKRMRKRYNKEFGITDDINIVFDREKNTNDNSVIYINFIKYISWISQEKIYLAKK